MPRAVSVVVPVPALDRLDYEVPPELPVPEPGTRVLVPLGTRVVTGCVVDRSESPASAALKPLLDILDVEPMLPPDVVGLALWVGEYYACGAGEAMAAAMPPRAWVVSERRVEITAAGPRRARGSAGFGAPPPAGTAGRRCAASGDGAGTPNEPARQRPAAGRGDTTRSSRPWSARSWSG